MEEKCISTLDTCLEQAGKELPENPLVVNVACGSCFEAQDFTDRFGFNFHGIDISRSEIARAKKEFLSMQINLPYLMQPNVQFSLTDQQI